MRRVPVKVYKFNELNGKAKAKVLQDLRYINVEFDGWDDPLIEGFIEELKELGYNNAKINYSGFSSQSDGLCFDAEPDLLKIQQRLGFKYPELEKLLDESKIYAQIVKTCWAIHYCHGNTRTLEIMDDCDCDIDQEKLNQLENLVNSDRKDLCRKFYKTLEKEYDYQTDDEQVIEAIEANDYEFLEDGSRSRF